MLKQKIELIPSSIPEADDQSPLLEFAAKPQTLVIAAGCSEDDDWELILNPMMKRAFGWAHEGQNDDNLIRRGQKGLDGFYRVIAFFVLKRGLPSGCIEPKLKLLRSIIEEK